MSHDQALRAHLRDLLTKPNAHLTFDDAVGGFPPAKRGIRHAGIAHTGWQLLEHLRITQWDIVEFSRSEKHISPNWPEEYWPKEEAPPNAQSWNESIAVFKADLTNFLDLIADESNDLYEPFAWGEGQTLLREALVLAKHNSYHIGQVVQLKKALGRG